MEVFINTDGGSRGNPGISGYGLVISDDKNKLIHQECKFLGIKTNNEAEYAGVIAALTWLNQNKEKYPISKINFASDSQLLVRQIQGTYKVKATNIIPLYHTVKKLLSELNLPYQFTDVRRDFNKLADELANQAMDSAKL